MKVDEKSATALQFILIALALFASWQMQYRCHYFKADRIICLHKNLHK